MNKNNSGLRRLTAIAGILAPLLFVGIFTIEGAIRPGYSPISMYISALSLGARGWIQIANFILFGVLTLFFTYGKWVEYKDGRLGKGAVIILAIIALFFLFSGPFVMDPMDTPLSQTTVHGTIHGILGGFVFLLFPICCFVFLKKFNADPRWKTFYTWTLVMAILISVAVLFFTIVSKSPTLIPVFKSNIGIIQRAALIPFMVWLFTFGLISLADARKKSVEIK